MLHVHIKQEMEIKQKLNFKQPLWVFNHSLGDLGSPVCHSECVLRRTVTDMVDLVGRIHPLHLFHSRTSTSLDFISGCRVIKWNKRTCAVRHAGRKTACVWVYRDVGIKLMLTKWIMTCKSLFVLYPFNVSFFGRILVLLEDRAALHRPVAVWRLKHLSWSMWARASQAGFLQFG